MMVRLRIWVSGDDNEDCVAEFEAPQIPAAGTHEEAGVPLVPLASPELILPRRHHGPMSPSILTVLRPPRTTIVQDLVLRDYGRPRAFPPVIFESAARERPCPFHHLWLKATTPGETP